jgi:hypothetical protein
LERQSGRTPGYVQFHREGSHPNDPTPPPYHGPDLQPEENCLPIEIKVVKSACGGLLHEAANGKFSIFICTFALLLILHIAQIDINNFDCAMLNRLDHRDSEMIVLQKFTQTSTVGTDLIISDGWVFTSKALLKNVAAVLQATNGDHVYLSCDGTFKLLHSGWVLLNLISETLVDSHGGKS